MRGAAPAVALWPRRRPRLGPGRGHRFPGPADTGLSPPAPLPGARSAGAGSVPSVERKALQMPTHRALRGVKLSAAGLEDLRADPAVEVAWRGAGKAKPATLDSGHEDELMLDQVADALVPNPRACDGAQTNVL